LEYPEIFVRRMNEKAKELGMRSTVMKDPAGIANESNAGDIMRCLLNVCTNDRIMRYIGTSEHTVNIKGEDPRKMTVTSKTLLSDASKALTDHYKIIGGKGGTLNRTKVYNSAVIAEIPDSDDLLACVIMGANEPNDMPDNRFKAARQALDMAMAKLSDESAVIDESTVCARSAMVCHVKGRDISKVHTLVSKSPEEIIRPASISKLLTTILTLENVSDLTAEITVTEDDLALLLPSFYQKDFKLGDTVTLDDAIYAMLLPSSNLAAYFIARYIGQLMSENK